MMHLFRVLSRLGTRGATAIEYALLAFGVAVTIIGATAAYGDSLQAAYCRAAAAVGASPCGDASGGSTGASGSGSGQAGQQGDGSGQDGGSGGQQAGGQPQYDPGQCGGLGPVTCNGPSCPSTVSAGFEYCNPVTIPANPGGQQAAEQNLYLNDAGANDGQGEPVFFQAGNPNNGTGDTFYFLGGAVPTP